MSTAARGALVAIFAASARGAAAAPRLGAAAISPREAFLAAAIAAIVACGLLGFFLANRVSQRTQAALALLVVLIGGFSLLTLFGPAGGDAPLVGGAILFGLIGLFKLMNQFEIQRRPASGQGGPPDHAQPRR